MVEYSVKDAAYWIVSTVFFVGGATTALLGLALLEIGLQETGSLAGWIGLAFLVMGILHMRPIRLGIDALNDRIMRALGRES